MPKITFHSPTNGATVVDAKSGLSLMEVARGAGIPEILAECGGGMACATCHVIVDPEWIDRVGAAGSEEADMIEFGTDPTPTSRLSCQIEVTDALDGFVVHLPDSQG